MANTYCMFKGKLKVAAPYFDGYVGSPHYVITVEGGPPAAPFNIVVNSASTAPGPDGDNRVYFTVDLHFDDLITKKLDALDLGLHLDSFPRLDYWQDHSLLDLKRMRPIPYAAQDGSGADINDLINEILTIDETAPFELIGYFGGRPQAQDRKFWKPTSQEDVIVYGFGFLFLPAQDGLHETHMNQGNPRQGGHAKENGVFQDGAVIVQKGSEFAAIFTAFQTQCVPTDSTGFPVADALALPQFIHNG